MSRLVNERSGISADMAIRLAKAFSTTPDYWMNMEMQYKLWQANLAYSGNVEAFDKAA
jgi:addiction module HigA family antidote